MTEKEKKKEKDWSWSILVVGFLPYAFEIYLDPKNTVQAQNNLNSFDIFSHCDINLCLLPGGHLCFPDRKK